jgi:uncharacterized membrane protein
MNALVQARASSRAQRIGARVFGAFFVLAGVNHFVSPELYLRMIPPYLPLHGPINVVSGAAEVLLGLGLFTERYRRLSALGSIALLVAVFPANVHVFLHQEILPAPPLAHLLRLPLQAVLIGFVWWAGGLSTKPR